jgi:VanZ family protein
MSVPSSQTRHVPPRALAPLVLLSVFTAYGSLYPFRFVPPPSLDSAILAMLREASWWTSRGDVAGNVLLFIPMGIAIVIAAGTSRFFSMRVAAWFGASLLFALALQILQIYFPPRRAALADVMWNAIGTTIGIAVSSALLSRLRHFAVDRFAIPAMLVVAFWFGWRLWPFVPTIDWQHVKNALKPLILEPSFNGWSFAGTAVSLTLIAAILPSLRHPQWVLAIVACTSLLVRPFLAGQVLTVALVAGTLAGAIAGILVLRTRLQRSGSTLLVVTAFWWSLDALRPFAFSSAMGPLHWIPFAALLQGAMGINLASLCSAAFVTGALMLLSARLGFALGAWCIAVTVWVVVLEIIQAWVPTRTADLTVAILPFGWWLILQFTRRPANH